MQKIFEGNYDGLDKFVTFITNTMNGWGSFEVTLWLNYKSNLRLQGKNTKEFTLYTNETCEELKKVVKMMRVIIYAFTFMSMKKLRASHLCCH